jgi:hypothetical protein
MMQSLLKAIDTGNDLFPSLCYNRCIAVAQEILICIAVVNIRKRRPRGQFTNPHVCHAKPMGLRAATAY